MKAKRNIQICIKCRCKNLEFGLHDLMDAAQRTMDLDVECLDDGIYEVRIRVSEVGVACSISDVEIEGWPYSEGERYNIEEFEQQSVPDDCPYVLEQVAGQEGSYEQTSG